MSRSGSERIWIPGPAGKLEALWLPAGDRPATHAVVLCHPHPLHGGSMHTRLVASAARRLSQSKYQTLRFNFRGVGGSEGTWDEGQGERADVLAVVDCLVERLPGARLALFGFSFGAALSLDVGFADDRVDAVVAVAPPVRLLPAGWFSEGRKPALIIAAGADEVVDPGELQEWASARTDMLTLTMLSSADHLFRGQTEVVADQVVNFLDREFRGEKNA